MRRSASSPPTTSCGSTTTASCKPKSPTKPSPTTPPSTIAQSAPGPRPSPRIPPAWVLEELKKPRDYTADLKKLLASPNICDKRSIYEQYDSMVQTNTVQGPGGEAGVIRIKGTGTQGREKREEGRENAPEFVGAATLAAPAGGLDPTAVDHSILGKLANLIAASTLKGEATLLTGQENATNPVVLPSESHTASAATKPSSLNPLPSSLPAPERGLAMALAGNGRWCYLDPKLGAMHAVAEAARKVACTGATPVAATNCLNFGNPEKPEIMAQLSAAIDGIAEACTALGTPVTGGNVSLYNETRGEGIYPTPVIGIVGILDDVTKAIPSSFQRAGDDILLVRAHEMKQVRHVHEEFGSSEYSKVVLEQLWGTPPSLRYLDCYRLIIDKLAFLATRGLIRSACDIGSGGLAVAICRASFEHSVGANLRAFWNPRVSADAGNEFPEPLAFFIEEQGLILTCKPKDTQQVTDELSMSLRTHVQLIGSTTSGALQFSTAGWSSGELKIPELRDAYSTALESQLAEEVFA